MMQFELLLLLAYIFTYELSIFVYHNLSFIVEIFNFYIFIYNLTEYIYHQNTSVFFTVFKSQVRTLVLFIIFYNYKRSLLDIV